MALNTSKLTIPGTSLGIVTDAALDSGLLPKLVASKPTLFGPVKGATFSGVPRAQIVGESEKKDSQDPFNMVPWLAEPVKAQITIRVSDEFKWADEDYQLGVLDDLVAPAIGAGMGRFVDLFVFHGINPLTGLVSAKATKYLAQATKVVEAAGQPTAELNTAVGLLAKPAPGKPAAMPSGIAMDGGYNYELASQVYPQGHSLAGQPMYPQMGFAGIENWRGLKASSSTTVSGLPELPADSTIRAILGDYTGQIKWGYQREIPLHMIEYGDPDQTGRDLQAHNEVALRSEVVIYAGIGDLDKFALVKDAA